MTNEIFWIAAILLFVALEASTATVVCIWFAGGALVALLSSALGASLKVQIFLFLFVSVLLVVLLRKIAFKTIKGKKSHTNLDRIIGSEVMINEEVNNKLHTGTAFIGDVEWKVKSENGDVILKDETAQVVAIEGVRLVVKNKEV